MRFQRRSAISYIMSVAIMTFVTLAMASVVLVWSLGQTATSQNTFSSAINANEAKAEERYTIEQVQFFSPSVSSTGNAGTCSNSGCPIIDAGTQVWTANQWSNYAVTITSGADSGAIWFICSNTGTSQYTLTISTTQNCVTPTQWSTSPGSGFSYTISSAPTGGYLCLSTNGCVLVYVRNVGSIQLVCDAIYINNQLALQTSYATGGGGTVPSISASRLSLGIQQLGSIAVPAPFALTSGTTYTISASTTRGNVVTLLQTY